MPVVLSTVCSNPECYNKPVVKRLTTVGNLRVEITLCNTCRGNADAFDFAQQKLRKEALFEAMTQYHQLHSMQGKVPAEMLSLAVERILDNTLEKL